MSTRTKAWRGQAAYEALLAERERDGLTLAELGRCSGVPESTLLRSRKTGLAERVRTSRKR